MNSMQVLDFFNMFQPASTTGRGFHPPSAENSSSLLAELFVHLVDLVGGSVDPKGDRAFGGFLGKTMEEILGKPWKKPGENGGFTL